ncbi:D-alanyl-D-alanine carboxypeptidase, partial [Streptomyces sp. SID7760]|nr:D-alanyl-D-alanine carboxypeptidase [Streptomyces sp. SID7760]
RIPSPLKRIRPTAFRATVERAAKEPTLPGAAVLPRTPQGTYRAVGC